MEVYCIVMYIRAWVLNGEITHCHCSDSPITRNLLEVEEVDLIVQAQVSNDYTDASEVRDLLSWNNEKLSGLDFVTQEIITEE